MKSTEDEDSDQQADKEFKYCGQRRFEIPSNITVLEICSSIERIEEAAFSNQTELQKAVIPSTIQRIERTAFANCCSLHDLQLVEGRLEAIDAMAFARCTSLTKLAIPSTVEDIGDNAFMNCTLLNDLHFQRNGALKRIGEYAFRRCESLQQASIPPSVDAIQEFAFDGCSLLVELSLSEGLQHIGQSCFGMCVSMQKVNIPSTVVALGEGSFCNCKALLQVSIPKSGGLVEICDNAFEGCCSLQTISIPETVSWIGDRAFSFCIALVSVELDNDNHEVGMGDGVFHMCTNLVNIAIPKDSTAIEVDAFAGCTFMQKEYASRPLIKALKERYDGLPIHKLCYNASNTTEKELLTAAARTRFSNGDEPESLVDAFGMTPFHTLASGTQRVDLFHTLIELYSSDLLTRRDKCGNRPLDYLCTHVSKKVHDLVQIMVQQTILDPASQLRLRQWRMEILDLVTHCKMVMRNGPLFRMQIGANVWKQHIPS